MEKVRIGIIGTGGVANSRHIKELLQCKNAKIVALCDIDLTALAKSAERTGVDTAHCYTDYRDLIADPIVDAIEDLYPKLSSCRDGNCRPRGRKTHQPGKTDRHELRAITGYCLG